MAARSPYVITLDPADRQTLEALSRRGRAEHRQVLRARIVLAAADGQCNADIARALGVVVDTVRKWRKRFCREGLPGLADRPRSGRPRVFPAAAVAEVKALACELPAQTEVPLARWSCPTKMLVAAVRAGVGRETAHELIKEHSLRAAGSLRDGRPDNPLLATLGADERFPLDIAQLTELLADRTPFTGVAGDQIAEIGKRVAELTGRFPEAVGYASESRL
ncbi:helix-turn-helix domain-containing protein [Amycolatopsis panacis]|uniref:helix-turn-helix domain-containing protein n=1 Tax=Amycolatopsis panacis TaxID=2340917 RepID=UPI001313EF37|nr:helix-turn-helix domain-containing protein [Amycolatopsis panacis]